MLLSIVISFIIIGVYVIINIIGEGPNLKDFIYFILIMFGVFLGKDNGKLQTRISKQF